MRHGAMVLAVLLAAGCGGGATTADSTAAEQASSEDVDTNTGNSGENTDAADAAVTSTTAPKVDYAALSEQNCPTLIEVVEQIAGPGQRTGTPFGPEWLTGTLKGGCSITGDDAVAIEIHLADPNRHSVPFLIRQPQSTAARSEAEAGIGDESYFNEDRTALVARRGLVEVSLAAPFLDDSTTMTEPQMRTLANKLLERWPTGPGADTSEDAAPPDIPIPAEANAADWKRADFGEINQQLVDAGGKAVYDIEVMPPFWSLPFPATTDVGRYCTQLEQAGITAARAMKLYGAADEDVTFPEGSVGCYVADDRYLLGVTGYTGREGGVMVFNMADVEHQQRICAAEPERCKNQ